MTHSHRVVGGAGRGATHRDDESGRRRGLMGTGGMAPAHCCPPSGPKAARSWPCHRPAGRAPTVSPVTTEPTLPRSHGHHDALVDDPDLDVVSVAITNDRHHADALACIAAGRPVLVENPFCLMPQAREVVDQAHARQVFLMEAMWMRFQPAFLEVERRIADGQIGQPQLLQADLDGPLHAPSRLVLAARGDDGDRQVVGATSVLAADVARRVSRGHSHSPGRTIRGRSSCPTTPGPKMGGAGVHVSPCSLPSEADVTVADEPWVTCAGAWCRARPARRTPTLAVHDRLIAAVGGAPFPRSHTVRRGSTPAEGDHGQPSGSRDIAVLAATR